MFRGIHRVNVDAKGRMAMPTRYRDTLHDHSAGQIVVTIDTEERCLLLYPMGEWEQIEEKLEALPSFNKAARRIQRLLMGHATELEIDAQGRFLIIPLLREHANIGKRVVLVGQGKKFEIWDEAHWQESRNDWIEDESQDVTELPDELKSLSL